MQVIERPGSAVSRLDDACAQLRLGHVLVAQRRLAELAEGAPWAGLGDVERATVLAGLVDCALARGLLDEAEALGPRLAVLSGADGVAGAIATFATAELDLGARRS